MMKELLSVRNLSIGIYRHEKLLGSVEDISFDVYPGEIVGLVGESGSGKSLTALSIPGLLDEGKKITGGSILFSGHDSGGADSTEALKLLELSEKELQQIRGRDISIIFQEPFSTLNPMMKIGDQIAETLKLHGENDHKRNKNRVEELLFKLKFLNPEKILNTYPHRLSGGMCQRVMIALAVICKPRLLIADEPTTALDQDTQEQILGLMKEINRDLGTSILFISHDLSVIKSLCTRLMVMYSGRILEEGKTADIFMNPAHEYTRGLLDSVPNIAHKGRDLAAIPGKIPSLEEGQPPGCPFHPRCKEVRAECREKFPSRRKFGPDHNTCCILYGAEIDPGEDQ